MCYTFLDMSVLLRVPLGLFVMCIGFLIVWKTETVYTWFGSIPFAEDKFGPGGSRFFYKLIGAGVVFIGIFIVTNIISDILEGFAGIFI